MKRIYYLLVILLLSVASVNSQVVIGTTDDPQVFSVLELVSNQRGLRLPQMTTTQRDAMTGTDDFKAVKEEEALGLVIFNTTTSCMEFWNGSSWVSLCDILLNEQPTD